MTDPEASRTPDSSDESQANLIREFFSTPELLTPEVCQGHPPDLAEEVKTRRQRVETILLQYVRPASSHQTPTLKDSVNEVGGTLDTVSYRGQELISMDALALTLLGDAVATATLLDKKLTELKINHTANPQQLQDLQKILPHFSTLKELDVSHTSPESLDLQGTRLKKVHAVYCRELTSITNLPPTLEELEVSYTSLETLELAGTGAERVLAMSCQELKHIRNLPSTLVLLDVFESALVDDEVEVQNLRQWMEVHPTCEIHGLPQVEEDSRRSL